MFRTRREICSTKVPLKAQTPSYPTWSSQSQFQNIRPVTSGQEFRKSVVVDGEGASLIRRTNGVNRVPAFDFPLQKQRVRDFGSKHGSRSLVPAVCCITPIWRHTVIEGPYTQWTLLNQTVAPKQHVRAGSVPNVS